MFQIAMQIFTRLLFIAGEYTQLIVVPVLKKKKKSVLKPKNFTISVIMLFVSVVVPMEINRKHYFWSELCILFGCVWVFLCSLFLTSEQGSFLPS